MRRGLHITILPLVLLTLLNWNSFAQPKNQLTQTALIDALIAGAYDGIMNVDELHSFGNFGLGTFDKLNGEMIVYDGNIYQVKYDGTVVKNNVPATTPFAAIINFEEDENFQIEKITGINNLSEELSSKIDQLNLPLAVKVTGEFNYVKVRSVQEQEKPYKPLAEAVKNQSIFEYENIQGTLIGFLIPEYFKSFNVPGLHVHFLSADEVKGGHLLDLKLLNGNVEIDVLNKFYVYLPDQSEHFNSLDLQKDRSKELDQIEK